MGGCVEVDCGSQVRLEVGVDDRMCVWMCLGLVGRS